MPAKAYRVAAISSLALLAAFLVTGGVLLLLRQDDNAPIQIIPPPAAPQDAPLPGAQGEAELRVYVNGAVARPGVYRLLPGDRLAEALAAAGGPLPAANLAAVNLARRVQDEGYYYIPQAGESPPSAAEAWAGAGQAPTAAAAPGALGAPAGMGLVDINTATAATLETLPGIGPKLAQAIVNYRAQNGPFRSPQDITGVHGIGPGIYQQVQHLITTSSPGAGS